MSVAGLKTLPYVCPACRAPVARESVTYCCAACGRSYPILCGIADFRLAPDRYLSLGAERAKAAYLHRYAKDHSFAQTVGEYYRITDDVPPGMARRYAGYVLSGEARGETMLHRLVPAAVSLQVVQPLLDAGCGAGGLVVAAARAGHRVCGLDIALRWLVIAAKRLEEEGLTADLVCADIAHPPFGDATFGAVAAVDLFEHLPDGFASAASIQRLLRTGGRVLATGANRHTLASHPVAGLWGVGFLPAAMRTRYVILRRGSDTLRHMTLLSPGALQGLFARAGFDRMRLDAMAVPSVRGRPGLRRLAVTCYRCMRSTPILNRLLLRIGPVFELTAHKLVDQTSDQRNAM